MARKSRKSNIYKRLFFCLIFINLLFLGYLIFQKTEWFSYLENKFHQTFIRSSIPEGDYIYGIDVSQYQGIIDWNKLNSKTNSYLVDFALIRATAGKNHRDIYYTYNWKQSKKMILLEALTITIGQMKILLNRLKISLQMLN